MNEKKDILLKNFSLAITNHKNKNYKLSEKYYYQALDINPKHTKSYYNLGILFYEIKNFKRAIDCFEKVLEMHIQIAIYILKIRRAWISSNWKDMCCGEPRDRVSLTTARRGYPRLLHLRLPTKCTPMHACIGAVE